jgi:hypothetical protein
MIHPIEQTIKTDIYIYDLTIIKLLIIISLFVKNIIIYLLAVIYLLYYFVNKTKIKIKIYKNSKYEIISIYNNKNILKNIRTEKYRCVFILIFYLLNISKHKCILLTQVYFRNYNYNYTNIIIRYPLKMIIPNKLILLLTHANNFNDLNHMSLILTLYKDHKKLIISRNIYGKNKMIQKIGCAFGNIIGGQYIITDENKTVTLYKDISQFIQNNDKVVVLIFPEGRLKSRHTNSKNTDNNVKDIKDFKINEDNCYNYRRGAFILSLMNSIPVQLSIFYLPVPNYNHIIDKEYKIKHINHLGIRILKPQHYYAHIGLTELTDSNILNYIDNNNNHIENYRSQMESIFKKQYIKTLLSAHKFNITND